MKKAEAGLNILNRWMVRNKLTLNSGKTTFVPFSIEARNLPAPSVLTIHALDCRNSRCTDCDNITSSHSAKYLGMYFDSEMKFKNQIQNTNTKLRKLLYIFAKLAPILSKKLLKQVYFALVESVLTYCLPVWSSTYKTNFDSIVKTQKALIRRICRTSRLEHTAQLFVDMKILPFSKLIAFSSIKQIIKTKQYNLPTHTSNTRYRSDYKLEYPLLRTTFAQNSYKYTSLQVFNNLPAPLREKLLYSKMTRPIKEQLIKCILKA